MFADICVDCGLNEGIKCIITKQLQSRFYQIEEKTYKLASITTYYTVSS